jgi:hypothetical protein
MSNIYLHLPCRRRDKCLSKCFIKRGISLKKKEIFFVAYTNGRFLFSALGYLEFTHFLMLIASISNE